MPNASRYLEPGYTYHLTHRCHDRRFLLKIARDRDMYRRWLREGARRYRVPVCPGHMWSAETERRVCPMKTLSVCLLVLLAGVAPLAAYDQPWRLTGKRIR
jgi:hypothetical protein